MRRGDAELLQRGPLVRVSGAVDLRADVTRELQRGHPDAAGGAVNEQRLARLQLREVDEPVIGGQEHDRHRRCLGERPAVGDLDQQLRVAGGQRPERVLHQTHHAITDRQRADVLADLDHDPGALAAEHHFAR